MAALCIKEDFVLKKYKNKLLEAIHQNGFDINEFRKHEKTVDGAPAFIIQLINSPLFFMIRTNTDDFQQHDCRYINFSPDYTRSEYEPDSDWAPFEYCYDKFQWWLRTHVKEYQYEIEAPDYWSELSENPIFQIDPLANRTSESFNRVEREKVDQALLQFKSILIEHFKPTQDQLVQIEDRINYLSESMERLNKVDWQGIAISTLISISIALSLDTDNGKLLFEFFKNSFSLAIEFVSN